MHKFVPFLFLPVFFLASCSGGQEQKRHTLKRADSSFSTKFANQFNQLVSHNYLYRNLSNEFNLQVHFKSFHDTVGIYDSAVISVVVSGKYNEEISDTLFLTALYNAGAFEDSNNVVSYSTKVNTDKQVVDNYVGDVVVADLNFDNLDDIAVISDAGGNGGPLYNYYLQSPKGKFIQDAFLTDSMTFFPQDISRQRKTLTTYVHAGACCISKTVYHLNDKDKKWVRKSHTLLTYKG